jgi:hypothetical protein
LPVDWSTAICVGMSGVSDTGVVVVVVSGVVVVGALGDDGVVVVVDPIGLVESVVDGAVVGGDGVVVVGVIVVVVVRDVDESAAETARCDAFLGGVDVDQMAATVVRMTRTLKGPQESHRLVLTTKRLPLAALRNH